MIRLRFFNLLIVFLISYHVHAQDSVYQFTTSDHVRLYLRAAGHGEPCLFLHGGPGNTSFYFEGLPVAGLLEKNMRIIYFDQRGGGRSGSAADSNYSMARMEQDIEEIRIFLGIQKWYVIGHSFGGIIMTSYVRHHPERVKSLVYAHCTIDMTLALHSHIDNGTRMLERAGAPFQPDNRLSLFKQMMIVHDSLARQGIEYQIMFRSQKEKDLEDSLIGASTEHFNQDFQHHVWSMPEYMQSYQSYTKYITCPVLIIAGLKDYAVGPDAYESWQFKNEKVLLYDGGHVSFQEEPKWFADAVLNFMKN